MSKDRKKEKRLRKLQDLELLTLKKPGKNEEYFCQTPRLREAVPANPLPSVKQLPLSAKIPAVPAPNGEFHLSRSRASEALWISKKEIGFDLDDPYMRETPVEYKELHDPNLKAYYREHPEVVKNLIDLGLLSCTGKVTCSLKDLNAYRAYLNRLQRKQVQKRIHEDDEYFKKQREKIKRVMMCTIQEKHFNREETVRLRRIQNLQKLHEKMVENLDKKQHCSYNAIERQRVCFEHLQKRLLRELRNRKRCILNAKYAKLERKRKKRTVQEYACDERFREDLKTVNRLEKKLNNEADLADMIVAKRNYQERKLKHQKALLTRWRIERECMVEKRVDDAVEAAIDSVSAKKRLVARTKKRELRAMYLMKKYGQRWIAKVRRKKEDAIHQSIWHVGMILRQMNDFLKEKSGREGLSNFINKIVLHKKGTIPYSPDGEEEAARIIDRLINRVYNRSERMNRCKLPSRKIIKCLLKCGESLKEADLRIPSPPVRTKNALKLSPPPWSCEEPTSTASLLTPDCGNLASELYTKYLQQKADLPTIDALPKLPNFKLLNPAVMDPCQKLRLCGDKLIKKMNAKPKKKKKMKKANNPLTKKDPSDESLPPRPPSVAEFTGVQTFGSSTTSGSSSPAMRLVNTTIQESLGDLEQKSKSPVKEDKGTSGPSFSSKGTSSVAASIVKDAIKTSLDDVRKQPQTKARKPSRSTTATSIGSNQAVYGSGGETSDDKPKIPEPPKNRRPKKGKKTSQPLKKEKLKPDDDLARISQIPIDQQIVELSEVNSEITSEASELKVSPPEIPQFPSEGLEIPPFPPDTPKNEPEIKNIPELKQISDPKIPDSKIPEGSKILDPKISEEPKISESPRKSRMRSKPSPKRSSKPHSQIPTKVPSEPQTEIPEFKEEPKRVLTPPKEKEQKEKEPEIPKSALKPPSKPKDLPSLESAPKVQQTPSELPKRPVEDLVKKEILKLEKPKEAKESPRISKSKKEVPAQPIEELQKLNAAPSKTKPVKSQKDDKIPEVQKTPEIPKVVESQVPSKSPSKAPSTAPSKIASEIPSKITQGIKIPETPKPQTPKPEVSKPEVKGPESSRISEAPSKTSSKSPSKSPSKLPSEALLISPTKSSSKVPSPSKSKSSKVPEEVPPPVEASPSIPVNTGLGVSTTLFEVLSQELVETRTDVRYEPPIHIPSEVETKVKSPSPSKSKSGKNKTSTKKSPEEPKIEVPKVEEPKEEPKSEEPKEEIPSKVPTEEFSLEPTPSKLEETPKKVEEPKLAKEKEPIKPKSQDPQTIPKVEIPPEAPIEIQPEVSTEAPTKSPSVEVPTQPPSEPPTLPPAKTLNELPVKLPNEAPVEIPKELQTEIPPEVPTEPSIEVSTEVPIESPKELPVEETREPTKVPSLVQGPEQIEIEEPLVEPPVQSPVEPPAEPPKEKPIQQIVQPPDLSEYSDEESSSQVVTESLSEPGTEAERIPFDQMRLSTPGTESSTEVDTSVGQTPPITPLDQTQTPPKADSPQNKETFQRSTSTKKKKPKAKKPSICKPLFESQPPPDPNLSNLLKRMVEDQRLKLQMEKEIVECGDEECLDGILDNENVSRVSSLIVRNVLCNPQHLFEPDECKEGDGRDPREDILGSTFMDNAVIQMSSQLVEDAIYDEETALSPNEVFNLCGHGPSVQFDPYCRSETFTSRPNQIFPPGIVFRMQQQAMQQQAMQQQAMQQQAMQQQAMQQQAMQQQIQKQLQQQREQQMQFQQQQQSQQQQMQQQGNPLLTTMSIFGQTQQQIPQQNQQQRYFPFLQQEQERLQLQQQQQCYNPIPNQTQYPIPGYYQENDEQNQQPFRTQGNVYPPWGGFAYPESQPVQNPGSSTGGNFESPNQPCCIPLTQQVCENLFDDSKEKPSDVKLLVRTQLDCIKRQLREVRKELSSAGVLEKEEKD